ncbi:MAG: hypothetical protein WEC75_06765 [Dehalococcoidia bacterium]
MGNWEFVHRWYMPFAWITLSWAVGVPVAIYAELGMQTHTGAELGVAYGASWVLRDDLLASMIPYLLNLAAAVWLFSPDGSTRWAAFWALLVGLARITAPVYLASTSDITTLDGRHYVDWSTFRAILWFQDAQMFFLGVMMWGVFARFVGPGQAFQASAHRYAEA